jgi:hypothetical protein
VLGWDDFYTHHQFQLSHTVSKSASQNRRLKIGVSKSAPQPSTPKEHLANKEQIMYNLVHMLTAAWMTATMMLLVPRFQP